MLDNRIALGAYEKQVILELDKTLTLREARVFSDKYGARMLFDVVLRAWENSIPIAECVHRLISVSLLLFRGMVPTPDAIAHELSKLNPKATPYSQG